GPVRLRIGRSQEADIIVRDDGISRIHALIEIQPGKSALRVFITDLGSSNGTRLRGERLTPKTATEVEPGDAIELGKSTYLVVTPNSQAIGKPRPTGAAPRVVIE